MFVKICGLTTLAAVQAAVDNGADAVGFVSKITQCRLNGINGIAPVEFGRFFFIVSHGEVFLA